MTSAPESAEPTDHTANSLDDLTDHVLAARTIATHLEEAFLIHLLGMALIEIAQRGASRSN